MKKYALYLLLLPAYLVINGCATLSSPKADLKDCSKYSANTAITLGKLSALAYETQHDRVKTQLSALGFTLDDYPINDKKHGTRGFLAYNNDSAVVVFTGTEDVKDWIQNAQVWTHDKEDVKGCDKEISIHNGFYRAVRGFANDETLMNRLGQLQTEGKKIYYTGHSLGGALASILAYFTEVNFSDKVNLQGVYTFGQPLTGDRNYQECFNAKLQNRTFRYVTSEDLVPRARANNDYKHVGTPLYFDKEGKLISREETINLEALTDYLKGDFLKDHSMDIYNQLLVDNQNVSPFNCN